MQTETIEEWLVPIIGPGFEIRYAPWIETGEDAETTYCVIGSAGGPGPAVQVRRKNYNVFFIGTRNNPGQSEQLLQTAEIVMDALNSEDGPVPCGAAIAAAIGEPVGPGLTEDNRAWVQINMQVTF